MSQKIKYNKEKNYNKEKENYFHKFLKRITKIKLKNRDKISGKRKFKKASREKIFQKREFSTGKILTKMAKMK